MANNPPVISQQLAADLLMYSAGSWVAIDTEKQQILDYDVDPVKLYQRFPDAALYCVPGRTRPVMQHSDAYDFGGLRFHPQCESPFSAREITEEQWAKYWRNY